MTTRLPKECAWIVTLFAAVALTNGQDTGTHKPASARQIPTGQGPATTQPTNPGEGPRLELNPKDMDFGSVWQYEPAKGEFTVKNVGTEPLTLEVKSSCGCTVPTRPKSPLQPGESDKFSISYDTSHRKGRAEQSITLVTNDPDQGSVQIKVHGEVKPLFGFDPSDAVSFGQIHSEQRVERTLKLENKYDKPVALKLKEGQDFGPFEVSLKELKPGMEFELHVATKPPLNVQSPRVEVALETGIERSPEIRIQVLATVQADVVCRPGTLFTSRSLTTPKVQNVEIASRPDKPVKITEVKPSVETIKCEILPPVPPRLPDGWQSQSVKITLPPGTELPEGEPRITILTDSADPRFQKFEVRVQFAENQPPRPGVLGPSSTQPGVKIPGPTTQPTTAAPRPVPAPNPAPTPSASPAPAAPPKP